MVSGSKKIDHMFEFAQGEIQEQDGGFQKIKWEQFWYGEGQKCSDLKQGNEDVGDVIVGVGECPKFIFPASLYQDSNAA